MDFGGTFKNYKETYGQEACPKIVEEKYCALLILINTKDVKEFSEAYHFLTDIKSKKQIKGLFNLVTRPLKYEKRKGRCAK